MSPARDVPGVHAGARKVVTDMIHGQSRFLTTSVVLLALGSAAAAQEVVLLRSGVVSGGSAGQYGEPDDRITCLMSDSWGAPLRKKPFAEGDFAAASSGSPALLVKPHDFWLDGLLSDGEARWIHARHSAVDDLGYPPKSVLYAIPFDVQTTSPLARIELAWAVDNRLGDNDGEPNEAGAYLNGVPLGHELRSVSDSYGNFALESRAFVKDVPLFQGSNVLYLYAREETGVVSGLIFSAKISIETQDCTAAAVTHCTSSPNSTGATATLDATGSLSLFYDDTVLETESCPPDVLGVFLHSPQPASGPFGDGVLCVDPLAAGYLRIGAPLRTDAGGSARVALQLLSFSRGAAIQAGDTRYFQFLHRDPGAGGAGFNLSHGMAVTFCR